MEPNEQESSWEPNQYQLVDFGAGRKLERFGGVLLDRPCAAAEHDPKFHAEEWSKATLVLNSTGKPVRGAAPAEGWQAIYQTIRFQLRLTPFGHVGLFPEQVSNWNWLTRWTHRRIQVGRTPTALNLFAYTGGSTLTLANAGASVAHIDASAPAVQWARRNASASGLADKPVRWIVEDAHKFVRREIRRGKKYDLVVLDPPSYGHGPSGQRWEIETHLYPLLADCIELLADSSAALLLTAHCKYPAMQQIAEAVAGHLPHAHVAAQRSLLNDSYQRSLDAGFSIRASDAS